MSGRTIVTEGWPAEDDVELGRVRPRQPKKRPAHHRPAHHGHPHSHAHPKPHHAVAARAFAAARPPQRSPDLSDYAPPEEPEDQEQPDGDAAPADVSPSDFAAAEQQEPAAPGEQIDEQSANAMLQQSEPADDQEQDTAPDDASAELAAAADQMSGLGSGAAFRALVRELSHRPGVTNPRALAAWIGRRKYGAKGFATLARHGLGDLDALCDVVDAIDCCDDDLNGFFDFIAKPFKAIGHVVSGAVHTVEKIPVLGKVVGVTLAVSPIGLAEHIAKGERLDHALLNHLKDQVAGVKELAPYATTVVSLVPGVGTGVAAAIAAGAALAEGKSITDAAMAAVKNAIPGGTLAASGFDAALRVAKGENVSKVALDEARAQLPGPARKAFDIGIAVATGRSLQNAVLAALGSLTPPQAKALLDAGTHAIAVTRGLADVARHLPSVQAQKGFQLAAGLLAHRGTNAAVLAKARNALTGDVRTGFDALLRAQEEHFHAAHEVLHGPSATTRIADAAASLPVDRLVRTVKGHPAVLFPARLSATQALIAADRVMRVAEGNRGTPKQRKAMSDAIVWTHTLATKDKDAEAARTLNFMALAKNVRGATEIGGKPVAHHAKPHHAKHAKHPAPKPREPSQTTTLVHSDGTIEHGAWKRVSKGTRGAVFGPLVNGRVVTHGYFVRA